jgi:hypothetical protein
MPRVRKAPHKTLCSIERDEVHLLFFDGHSANRKRVSPALEVKQSMSVMRRIIFEVASQCTITDSTIVLLPVFGMLLGWAD